MSQQLTANFHGTTLSIVNHNDQPYVSAKQIAEAIGLQWEPQYSKLNKNRERWSITKIVMVAADNRQRSTVCLPLRKLPGWLMTIQPNKLSNELRPKVIQYQNECDDILWAHWEKSKQPAQTENTLPANKQSRISLTPPDVDEVTQKTLLAMIAHIQASGKAGTITAFIHPKRQPVMKLMKGNLCVFENKTVIDYTTLVSNIIGLNTKHLRAQTEFLASSSVVEEE